MPQFMLYHRGTGTLLDPDHTELVEIPDGTEDPEYFCETFTGHVQIVSEIIEGKDVRRAATTST